jgi:quercetin dioxygenase-like cupin family protein
MTPAPSLLATYLRLRPDSAIEELPAEGFWQRLMGGALGNFHHEYLVTTAHYSQSWQSWEQHPMGEEIVCLLSGRVTLIQERDGQQVEVQLAETGQYALNPRGTWHTADVHENSLLLFITAGEGTVTRPRS